MTSMRSDLTFNERVLLAVANTGYSKPLDIIIDIKRTTGKRASVGKVYAAIEALSDLNMVQASSGPGTPERGGRPQLLVMLTGHGAARARELMKINAGAQQRLCRQHIRLTYTVQTALCLAAAICLWTGIVRLATGEWGWAALNVFVVFLAAYGFIMSAKTRGRFRDLLEFWKSQHEQEQPG